jgi:hypothetical protein
MEWKSIALRQRGRFKTTWEEDVKHALKVIKIYHWKKKAKVGMNFNGSLSRPKFIKSFRTEQQQ